METVQNPCFGHQLQMYRKHRQLTQLELSGLSALSVRAIRNLEQGQVAAPRRDTVRLLADALQLTKRERISFNVAAGHDDDDAVLDMISMSAPEQTRPMRGRERELEMICRKLIAGRQSIITITGFCGVGKTRLALSAAREACFHGCNSVLWIPADYQHASAPWTAELLTQTPRLVDRVVRLVGDRAVVLVFDGNDAGQVTRETMHELQRRCAGLRIIETTRVPQGLAGEFEVRLKPLSTSGQGLSPAMELFLECIAESHVGPVLDEAAVKILEEVARSLDGLPGALEAAASWLQILSYQQLLDIAKSDPHLIFRHPGDGAAVTLASFDALTNGNRAHLELITELGLWEGTWSVNDVVSRLGAAYAQAAEAIYALLGSGIIIQVPGAAHPAKFAVLGILRSLLREEFRSQHMVTRQV